MILSSAVALLENLTTIVAAPVCSADTSSRAVPAAASTGEVSADVAVLFPSPSTRTLIFLPSMSDVIAKVAESAAPSIATPSANHVYFTPVAFSGATLAVSVSPTFAVELIHFVQH